MGQWSLTVPPAESLGPESGDSPIKVKTVEIPLNVGLLQPTMMETWKLLAIRVPALVTVQNEHEVALTGETTCVMRLILRYGGDIVWSQELTPELQASNPPEASTLSAAVVFSDSFQNPITVQRGRLLTLELETEVRPGNVTATENHVSLYLAMGTTAAPRLGEPVTERREGTIEYDSEAQTGHRTL